ncbi:MAG: hypothetical protein ACD_57C00086G0002 [uncultured bacterium]|uniref:HEPN domain-containing protein n=1 Tax=Candidatus Woesebacteria bacterium RIFCSPHIGHO2_12_FULL_41_24 TaxID=1802510 RepID=A0A1F8AWE3_9BACT|nr:MAG: hypothetical protein ACD_57C00086G0002 [uncultured bacterium]OGM15193.1 MAG: hypothetical protein A2W15_00170 [Candidatus Woesebacteria bacterium RBG_16_41_13]OGM28461.1 MAG: hypothetical protein A2873_04325 [Candidatus Woesebacteria bacterium RIFCSPHIGHO2_01_FULL_42_80]OGM34481.1 MAG: hypothetical protein A3D84_04715 [Candidatus Woesebacteria bacterium RIFCSPHIGHO2_02_FULL_42_20]OGM55565.1 MAG: hypothetical protein A3E44_04855 [Candidatus Woesebacteria bacterium RIFCSPHIGHO2_12_FULL_41
MSKKAAIKIWREGAKRNFKIAQDMFKLGHFDWALFLGQLALEKLLKGLVTKKTDSAPPYIHNLVGLASAAKIDLTKNQENELADITKFHVQARYDEIKYKLYKTAIREYTSNWFKIIRRYYKWLEKLY